MRDYNVYKGGDVKPSYLDSQLFKTPSTLELLNSLLIEAYLAILEITKGKRSSTDKEDSLIRFYHSFLSTLTIKIAKGTSFQRTDPTTEERNQPPSPHGPTKPIKNPGKHDSVRKGALPFKKCQYLDKK